MTLALSALANAEASTTTKKPTTTTTKKTVVSKKPTVKKPTVKKPTVKKKYVAPKKKYTYKKKYVAPKPKVVWPPAGFPAPQNGVYAKIPTGAQLVSQLSASSQLITECEQIACGAINVAAETPCDYWVFTANVNGPDPADVTKNIIYGSLRVLVGKTAAKKVYPIILRSGEPMIPHETLILQTLNIKKDAFYKSIAQGKSLTEIAGSNINAIVKAITKAELESIDQQLASNLITSDQASALQDETSARVSVELTQYNLTVGGIQVSCWTGLSTETVPSKSYTQNPNHF
jgi:hypothetical protein